MNYILSLSRFLYQVLASPQAPQELLSVVLNIYKNTEMLTVYKSNIFQTTLRQSLSTELLQVGL